MQKLGFDFTTGHWHGLLASYRPARVTAVQGHTRVRNEILRSYFISRGFIREEREYDGLLARLAAVESHPPYPAAAAVVPAVKTAGALISIAHPGGYFAGADEARMDALRAECGLDGIECAHPSVRPTFTPIYRAYCVRHGLVSTAGGDVHEEKDLTTRFARHGGAAEWLDEVLARLSDQK
jgi:predicted metal-dependent phosphoesterase TrpH